jgi:hypothetical protein
MFIVFFLVSCRWNRTMVCTPSISRWDVGCGPVSLSDFGSPEFFSTCLQIWSYFFVYGRIMIGYRSSTNIVPLEWFFSDLWPFYLVDLLKMAVIRSFRSTWLQMRSWYFCIQTYHDRLQIKFEYCSDWMIFLGYMAALLSWFIENGCSPEFFFLHAYR